MSEHSSASREDSRAFLRALVVEFGRDQVATLLAVPVWRLEGWLAGRVRMFGIHKRLIWLLWATFHAPWKLRSAFDIITSGRFVPDPQPKPAKRKPRRKL